MPVPEISAIATRIDRYLADGFRDSADCLLASVVPNLIRPRYGLRAGTEYLAHYTSVDALLSILRCPVRRDDPFALGSGHAELPELTDTNCLRAYDTYNANDPNEGRYFVSLSQPHDSLVTRHPNVWALLEDRSLMPAYVASFRSLTRVADVDDLDYWRAYGDGGRGCAIVFPLSFMADTSSLLQVRYGKESVKAAHRHLFEVLESLNSVPGLRDHLLLSDTNPVPEYLSSSLSPIPYLHKSYGFESESEARIIVPFADVPPGSLYCHRRVTRESGTTFRHYVELKELRVDRILRTGSRIMLGPAVSSARNIQFVLKQRLVSRGLVGTSVCTSRLDYRS